MARENESLERELEACRQKVKFGGIPIFVKHQKEEKSYRTENEIQGVCLERDRFANSESLIIQSNIIKEMEVSKASAFVSDYS